MKYSQALAAALSAVLCGSFASASPKDIAGLAGVAEQAEHLIENCFRDEKGVIRSAIGRDLKPLGASGKLDDPGVSGDFLRFDGCPLREDFISYENSGMVMGAYLVAMTEKFRKTGEASARDRARRTFQGIRTVYRASQSVARGFFCKPWGGRPSRETSSDQYVYVMNGLDRYCAIADETERREIALMIGDMARFWIDRGYRYLYYGSPIDWQKSRFLSFCALAYRQTGDAFFRREFERLLALPEVRNTIPFGIGCYPVDALRDSRGRQVYEMCPEQFSSAWLSLKAVRELAADDAYVTGTMPRIFAAVRPAISKEGFCHRYMVKDVSGAFVALEETLPDCGARPPWNWKFLSLRRPFHIGGMQSAMFLAAAIDMAPHDPVVGQWVGEHALPLLSRIANGHFTWYEDPLGVLPAEDKWMTRVLNGDAVAHWLQAYWTLSPEAVSVRQAVTNGVEVRWFETWMPTEDGARLYTYGTAPKEGVRCPQFRIRHPKVAQNRVFGDGSELILPVCDPK